MSVVLKSICLNIQNYLTKLNLEPSDFKYICNNRKLCQSSQSFYKINIMSETEALTKRLIKCVHFAAIKHRMQRRMDPEATPYINHPIGVAQILTEEANITDPIVLEAALLHDTVEDTDTSFEEIEREFGKVVADVVKEVTDDKSLPKQVRKQLQIDHAAGSSHSAKLVKLADKLYNLRDLERCVPLGWTTQRVQEYFLWSRKVVDQLRGTNVEMENQLDKLFAKHV